MRSILLVSAALSVLLTPALSTPLSNPLHFLPSFSSLSQPSSGVNFTFDATGKYITRVWAGSENNTLSVSYSFDLPFTVLIGSECKCGLGNYNSTKSLEDGYLEYVTQEITVMEVSEIL